MQIKIVIDNIHYLALIDQAVSIAINLDLGGPQPNHFGAPNASSHTLEMGSYIGDTRRGGSCNANVLTLIPHCNGTHTESVSHIINQLVAVHKAINQSLFPTRLISLRPIAASQCEDSYQPSLQSENQVFTREQLENSLMNYSDTQLHGLVVRSLPNDKSKKQRCYDQQNYPPFFTNEAMDYIFERGVQHLLVDFPSVDKMYDDGLLSNHRIFLATSATLSRPR
ncbi:MAG: cyclase family protein [Enterobacterales bacterium]|nr:cyclase family protein [Enterobacterales bacterium]